MKEGSIMKTTIFKTISAAILISISAIMIISFCGCGSSKGEIQNYVFHDISFSTDGSYNVMSSEGLEKSYEDRFWKYDMSGIDGFREQQFIVYDDYAIVGLHCFDRASIKDIDSLFGVSRYEKDSTSNIDGVETIRFIEEDAMEGGRVYNIKDVVETETDIYVISYTAVDDKETGEMNTEVLDSIEGSMSLLVT